MSIAASRHGACALLLLLLPAVVGAAQPLPGLAASTGDVTVSGISSGGYMAVQFQVDHSSIVRGAGIVAGLGETIEILKSEEFDLIIDLQKTFRSLRICSALGSKTIRFDKMNVRKWMAVNLKINRLPTDKHLVDRYFEALQEIGIQDDGECLDYYIMPEDEYDAQGLVSGINYQVLVLGATYFTKRIPKEKCEEIIAITEKHTVLLGGTDVSDLAAELAGLFPEKVINFCGKIGLGVSAGMIKNAKKIITGDTGLMHIPVALQKKSPSFGVIQFLNLACIPIMVLKIMTVT